MESRLSGASIEGFRMRRPGQRDRLRPARVALVGEDTEIIEIARRLARVGCEVIVSAESPLAASALSVSFGGAVRVTVNLDGVSLADLLVVRPSPASSEDARVARVRDAALWAARTCSLTAMVIAAPDALRLSCEAARASGLAPQLILSPGAMPRSFAESFALASRLGAAPSQAFVPTFGGETTATTWPLSRFASVAGIPVTELAESPTSPGGATKAGSTRAAGQMSVVAATVAIARAVLQDRREVLCCGGWVEGAHGLPGAFVSVPMPVGARGAEEPLPIRFTLEEKALLQKVARVP